MELQDVWYLALAIFIGQTAHEWLSIATWHLKEWLKKRNDRTIRWKDIPPDGQAEHAEAHYSHRYGLVVLITLLGFALTLGGFIVGWQALAAHQLHH